MLLEPIPFAHQLVRKTLKNGDVAVDATCGRGRDTVVLAQSVGKDGRVLAFDIQQEALDETYKRLKEEDLAERVQFFSCGHERASEFIDKTLRARFKAVMFNLGYLPGGDKTIVTRQETTLTAVDQLFSILQPGGFITVMIYSGHIEGKREREAILHYCQSLDQQKSSVLRYDFINRQNDPPFLLVLEKK